MPRTARIAPGGIVFHVLNRAIARMRIFDKEGDYEAFERVIRETVEFAPMRICAYCVMPNHWHFLLWPREDGDLARFMHRLTLTHVRRWQEHRRLVGTGHVYQGRYKSFPVESDAHFLSVTRYVERNSLRANLVAKAQDWPWSSAWRREIGTAKQRELLAEWPVRMPGDWAQQVNRPEGEDELAALRLSLRRGRPYGTPAWQRAIAKRLGLESTYRPRGRPRSE